MIKEWWSQKRRNFFLKEKKNEKKIFLWDWWIQGWSQLGFEWEIEAKGKRKVTFLSFFSLFTFLGYPPQKIFKSKLQPLHPPSHHNHPTTVLPTRHPTWWWCFDCDRMSSIRMISYHGNQNYLPSPTSKTSCDRYSQPPKIKPTPPCSPDDALPARMSIMAS